MSNNEKSGIDLGVELTKKIYADAKLVTNEVQPYYVLHKDTIRTFLHEKMAVLTSQGKLVGLLGIDASLIVCLLTAEFKEWHSIKGATIEAVFFISVILSGLLTIKEIFVWFRSRKSCTIDDLTTELGKRGSIIESKSEQKS